MKEDLRPVGLNLAWTLPVVCCIGNTNTHTSINLININKSRLLPDKYNREERLLEMNDNEWQWPYNHINSNVSEEEDLLQQRILFEPDSQGSDSQIERNTGELCENCICRRLQSICSCKNGEKH